MSRMFSRVVSAAIMGLLFFPGLSAAQTGPTITAVVEAGSVGNSFNVYVSNADSFTTLRSIEVRPPASPRYVTNVQIKPPRIENLGPNSSQLVTVTFDINSNVPDAGARETANFTVSAAEGILDFSELDSASRHRDGEDQVRDRSVRGRQERCGCA